MNRILKRIIIGLIYIIIFSGIGYGIYYSSLDKPSCADGIQNGKEEGIDCGTLACSRVCEESIKPLIIKNTEIKSQMEPKTIYEVLISIENLNSNYGAKSGKYELNIFDENGNTVKTKESDIYILPGQTKYFVEIDSIDPGVIGQRADVRIKSVEWVKADDFLSSIFSINRESLPTDGRTSYEAVILNNSDFDFDNVDVVVLVKDNAGNFKSANKTNLQTFLAKTERAIKVDWPFPFVSGERFEIQVTTNVFNNANYLKGHGTQEQFQKYY